MTARRRQTDRRAASIDALLDATIESLIEVGYSGTTTRRVALRAGVSQGAQQHYYASKSALVEAAMNRLLEHLVAEAASRPFTAATEPERLAELLDRLWELHNLPIAPAVLELFNVSRTDTKFGVHFIAGIRAGMETITSIAHAMLPTYASRPGFDELIQVVMATLRGTVMVAAAPGATDLYPDWQTLRDQLITSFDALLDAG